MRAIYIDAHKVAYADNREMPRLTSHCNVLVKVFYAGICRTDVGIARGTIPAKDGVVLGHEFCGEIVGFLSGGSTLNGWSVGDAVSANPMLFGDDGTDVMCGKDCDGAFAEYIAVPDVALVRMAPPLLTPLGAFLEPVAAALAPFKYTEGMKKVGVFGNNRIALLTCQVARLKGLSCVEHVANADSLGLNCYDCIIETEAEHIDLYLNALKPGGMLILKSRLFSASSITPNTIAMKEIRIQGARYGDFGEACRLLSRIDTNSLFGSVYELCSYKEAFLEAEQHRAQKIFFSVCAE